jgi:uncharacterized protein (TIGR02246 family)
MGDESLSAKLKAAAEKKVGGEALTSKFGLDRFALMDKLVYLQMRNFSFSSPTIALSILLAAATVPALAQDIKPDPADAEAVRTLLQKATGALVNKDQKTFLACCDDYVDCFFLDGTLIKGKKRIATTLHEFFTRRPDDFAVKHEDIPRSYRVLSPEIMMVDWPATAGGPGGMVTVNTLTTVRKVEGRWLITSYLESVPYTSPIGGRNATPRSP